MTQSHTEVQQLPYSTPDYRIAVISLKSEPEPTGQRLYYGVINRVTHVVEGVGMELAAVLGGMQGMQEALTEARARIEATSQFAKMNTSLTRN